MRQIGRHLERATGSLNAHVDGSTICGGFGACGRQGQRGKRRGDEHGAGKHAERERARDRPAHRLAVEHPGNAPGKRALRRRDAVRAEQQAGAFVAGDADQQLGIIGIDDVGGEHAVVGRFLAQLVRFAGEHPDQRIEPEKAVATRASSSLIQSSRATCASSWAMIASASPDASTARLLSRMTGRIRPQLIGEASSSLVSSAVPCLNPIRRCARASALSQWPSTSTSARALQGDQPAKRKEGDEQQDRRRHAHRARSPRRPG